MKVLIDADVIAKSEGGVRLRLHTGFGNPEVLIDAARIELRDDAPDPTEPDDLMVCLSLMDERWGGYQNAKGIIRDHVVRMRASNATLKAEVDRMRLELAQGCTECGYVEVRPVKNCGHVGDDGCCEHPYNMTPECHTHACPLVDACATCGKTEGEA